MVTEPSSSRGDNMKAPIMTRILNAIKLLQLDGFDNFTDKQLAQASGISTRTIDRNRKIIDALKFAISYKEYEKCYVVKH